MSLFANDQFRWRETYFVLFRAEHLPTAAQLQAALEGLRKGLKISEVSVAEDGRFEAMTVLSPMDFAGMDLSFVDGEEVAEQVAELREELSAAECSPQDGEKLTLLARCDARFDVYHFQQVADDGGEDDDEFLDPGSLLEVIACLAGLCQGIGVDPQSGLLL